MRILKCVALLGVGFLVGLSVRTRDIDEKIHKLNQMLENVRDANNKMVSNIALIESAVSDGSEGTFTALDEELLNMWI